jgi:dienelactone hydrolase
MPMMEQQGTVTLEQPLMLPAQGAQLRADLIVPEEAYGLVVFAADAQMCRSCSRSRRIAREFEQEGLAVLLVDLFTSEEEEEVLRSGPLHDQTDLLAGRLRSVMDWIGRQADLNEFPVGLFAQGDATAAALRCAAEGPRALGAVVCRDARLNSVQNELGSVCAPVMLLAGASDSEAVAHSEAALIGIGSKRKEAVLVPGSSNCLDDPEELETVAELAANWFSESLIALY